MMLKRLLTIAVAMLPAAGLAAEATGNYADDLATVYGGYQRLLALKEACDNAVPDTRSANERAFNAWRAQQRGLLQELQNRVTAMIRLASKDENEYVRNLGKYEGAILLQRVEYRDTLVSLGANELRGQCTSLPDMLKGPDADLEKVYAAELATVRKRKL